jgi:5,10-methylenetetrahydrofolate reductase
MAHADRGPEIVWEVDPPSNGDARVLDEQLDAIRGVASTVLVPDNHTGRATVSSVAVARHVQARGFRAMACLNARDRNLLGLRRDLLTCAFEGIEETLLVHGDEPPVGDRATDLTVRRMLDECRTQTPDLRVAVTTRLTSVPQWKLDADQLFVQVSYDLDALRSWRGSLDFDGPVTPAVMVIPSVAMAERLAARIPELQVPRAWLDAIEADPGAGTELAVDLAERILETREFDGVHMVAGRRCGDAAERLRTSPLRRPCAIGA